MKYALLINTFIVLLVTIGTGIVVFNINPKSTRLPDKNAQVSQANTYAFESDRLSVNITYPVIPGNSLQSTQANVAMRQKINAELDSFRNGLQPRDDFDLPASVKNYYEGSPTVEEQNERYVSFAFNVTGYGRGAAHPFHTVRTFIYDFQDGTLIGVADMFKPGSKYLELLSKLSREDLMKQSASEGLDFKFIESDVIEGTKPTEENFQNVAPTKDGFKVIFQEYQVAPYAAGPQHVVIPYGALKDVIDQNGILGMYIQ